MSDPETPTKPDYRSTVFLPKTDFPMKAGLPQKEPAIAARWAEQDLYGQLRKARAGREKFIFHDGPPYANGNMHIGHALNHTLKDMVVRTQNLLGRDAPYVPGWDCHGLPIEWAVEEQYRKQKRNKDEVPVREFRAECRAYAQHWVDVQREQLKRLGINADWAKPYLTMARGAEATIVSELFKFAESGQLYRGAKPVMWSPVEKTALAEAEIEYEDVVSTQIDVAFEIVESPITELIGAHAVVWTTTPWTIPVNQGIAYGPEVKYRVVDVIPYCGSLATNHKRFLIATDLRDEFEKRVDRVLRSHPDAKDYPAEQPILDLEDLEIPDRDNVEFPGYEFLGSELAGTIARHPMHALGGFFAKPRPFLPGDFVTTDQGTGLVHMAPDHGEDDFELCRANGIDPVFAVDAAGFYRADWAWLGGQGSVINAKFNAPDGPICSDLRDAGALLAASADFQHSYPHSWRSKAKVIYRCTPQWFIAMDKPLSSPLVGEDQGGGRAASAAQESHSAADAAGPHPNPSPQGGGTTLRSLALQAIADTRFVPEKGRNRLGSMVEGRPDWVISRQRAWGVPIALFVDKKSGELLVDHEVNERIVEAVRQQGVDAWDEANAGSFLGNRNPDDYEMVTDILDVWFDSGCTHVFTLESGYWPEERWPADLYLEGSDQHRGWFQSSLLESCGTRGRAPYDAVLTHGFTMDSKGMKMSKSLGNTVDPLKVMETYGADIIRLWALSVDFTEDHRIGDEILGGVADQYRKLRNTFRYLLGGLDGFSDAEKIGVDAMPELEKYVLHLTAELDKVLRRAVADFDFNTYVRALTDFCNEDLSAFYFDIRKDVLYCEINAETGAQTDRRRANRTVLDILFHALVRWLAPVLVFTTEEVWGTRYPEAGSVHLLEWPEVPAVDIDEPHWARLRTIRERTNEKIEPLRKDKEIGSSLEAEVRIRTADAGMATWLDKVDEDQLAEILIVSSVNAEGFTLDTGVPIDIDVVRTKNQRCERCRRYMPDVDPVTLLDARCAAVLDG